MHLYNADTQTRNYDTKHRVLKFKLVSLHIYNKVDDEKPLI